MLANLSRYTHRVAFANGRLIALDERGVTFQSKDYRAKGRCYKPMTLPVAEFMRRFLLHVLSPGFHRIRHDGLLANAARVENLARARELLAAPLSPLIALPGLASEAVASDGPTDKVRRCPFCVAPMVIIECFASGHAPRAPPAAMREAASASSGPSAALQRPWIIGSGSVTHRPCSGTRKPGSARRSDRSALTLFHAPSVQLPRRHAQTT